MFPLWATVGDSAEEGPSRSVSCMVVFSGQLKKKQKVAAATQVVLSEMQEEPEPVLDVYFALRSSFTTCVAAGLVCVAAGLIYFCRSNHYLCFINSLLVFQQLTTWVSATISCVAAAVIFAAINDCSLGVATIMIYLPSYYDSGDTKRPVVNCSSENHGCCNTRSGC